MKFIVVTGGVMSGLGKGITASTTGLLLKDMGLTVTAVKIDPYLNVDAGTMSPYEHGECYVLDDGSEVDLDLGNYERFLNITLTGDSSITTGKVYQRVIAKERSGEYLGKTVQIVPHLTNEIMSMLETVCKKEIDGKIPDVCIIEMGGTIGDIEGMPFIEALRQMANIHNMCFIHLSMLVQSGNELKTKPTQTSLKELNRNGIFPHILCIRTPTEFSNDIRNKLSMFCQVSQNMIICNTDVNSIYDVPILFNSQNLGKKVCGVLGLSANSYTGLLDKYSYISSNTSKIIKCVIVGKYTESNDTYLSIIRALEHASIATNKHVEIVYIAGEDIENSSVILEELITDGDVVIIPGGFGTRGINGMMKTIMYCKDNNVPILGICFGFQLMVISLCRAIGLNEADSEEFSSTEHHMNVVNKVDIDSIQMGGTMRLGSHLCYIDDTSIIYSLYKNKTIEERHRHRYEVDKDKINLLIENNENKLSLKDININFVSSSIHKDHTIYEILEMTGHKFFVGCQFHPEFLSRLEKPHPLFIGLLC